MHDYQHACGEALVRALRDQLMPETAGAVDDLQWIGTLAVTLWANGDLGIRDDTEDDGWTVRPSPAPANVRTIQSPDEWSSTP